MDPFIIGPLDWLEVLQETERREALIKAHHEAMDIQRRASLSRAVEELKAQLKVGHVDHSN